MDILNLSVNILGALIFIFIFWKKLKEDFVSDAIFTSAFYVLIGILLMLSLSIGFFRSYWFWSGLAGVIFGSALSYYRFRLKIYETIEALVVALLPWLLLVFGYDGLLNSNLGSIVFGGVILALILIYLLLDAHYKKFSWYKSGRVGFSGLTVLGMFFGARAIVALTTTSMLSFAGKSDPILSGVVAFLAFVGVFNLAQKSIH